MFPRIKELKPMEEYKLFIVFDDNEKVLYDVENDINTIEDFQPLKDEPGLFKNAQLDSSRTCVYWSDRIDLPSDTILEYGARIRKV